MYHFCSVTARHDLLDKGVPAKRGVAAELAATAATVNGTAYRRWNGLRASSQADDDRRFGEK
jgi:hypothetical protein